MARHQQAGINLKLVVLIVMLDRSLANLKVVEVVNEVGIGDINALERTVLFYVFVYEWGAWRGGVLAGYIRRPYWLSLQTGPLESIFCMYI